ncbi:hypothetical protein RHMOL_Rhmol10G0163900 [Rhododendron molle]|uniref:Uncharacterized protein n=1 Tax=Rhododendron molle TaxID=49168 RepID=A0ACC0M418_RHOML|nr:hypothetical protein RHMOL_Rhmol10G0163900 [Rhododendron molle]
MADGTISFSDGLGSKALDSNEIRRKLRGIDPLITKSSVTSPQLDFAPVSPNINGAMSDSTSQPQSRPSLPENSIYTSPMGVQSRSPSSGTATKLQQAIFEEGLAMEAEERARHVHRHHLQQEADPVSSSTGFGVHSPKSSKSTSPS